MYEALKLPSFKPTRRQEVQLARDSAVFCGTPIPGFCRHGNKVTSLPSHTHRERHQRNSYATPTSLTRLGGSFPSFRKCPFAKLSEGAVAVRSFSRVYERRSPHSDGTAITQSDSRDFLVGYTEHGPTFRECIQLINRPINPESDDSSSSSSSGSHEMLGARRMRQTVAS